jgi:hypothetical protein
MVNWSTLQPRPEAPSLYGPAGERPRLLVSFHGGTPPSGSVNIASALAQPSVRVLFLDPQGAPNWAKLQALASSLLPRRLVWVSHDVGLQFLEVSVAGDVVRHLLAATTPSGGATPIAIDLANNTKLALDQGAECAWLLGSGDLQMYDSLRCGPRRW